MDQIVNIIECEEQTQREAARRFGVTQPRVSDLVCGEIGLFSIDMPVRMPAAAGIRVSFIVEPVMRGAA